MWVPDRPSAIRRGGKARSGGRGREGCGVRRRVVESFLSGPMFEPLAHDYDLFCQLQVDPQAGTIVWPNEADISPRTLYAESKPKVPA